MVGAAGHPRSFLAFLDFFIVNIALPAMRDDLGARPAEPQLAVAGYGIGFSVFLITGGRLGDIFGRRRVFLVGSTGFTLASALCGLAPTPTILIAARALQAITAATVVPQILAAARRPPRQLEPVRLVVAADLPHQYSDRARRDRPGIEHGGSRRRRTRIARPVPLDLSDRRGP